VPSAGVVPAAGVDTATELPPPLRGVGVVTLVVPGVGDIGVVADRAEGTFTGILAVEGRAFALLDAEGMQRRLAAWSDVLCGRGREGGSVHRLAWVDATAPEDGVGIARYLARHRAPAPDSEALRSYEELVATAAPAGQRHDVVVAVTVSSRTRRTHSPTARDPEPFVALVRELDQVAARLAAADVAVLGALGPATVTRLVGSGTSSGPMGTETHWDCVRVDDGWHATFWVAEWPRVAVGPDFLAPLLVETTAVRRVAVIMAPVPMAKATKAVEMARTHFLSDEELRSRAGFLTTARREREHEGIVRRERELADGHLEYRFSGYLTVSASDRAALEAAVAEVTDAASRSRLELRRLYGQQDAAFGLTLPLGRGLR
ncbi:MAG: hypothetical protein JO265_10675, partial [Acidimicrobiia bacterium]|nr:hypothetical protein [Acidimicrobiia bacterium]